MGEKNNRTAFKVMLQLIQLVAPLTDVMLFAILTGVLGFVCAIAISVLGGYGLVAVVQAYSTRLPMIFLAIVLCAVLRGVLHYIEQSCNHYIAFKLLAHLRDKVFTVLRKLTPAKLDGANTGNIIAILTGDIELLEVFYAHTVSPICIAFIMGVILVLFIGQFHAVLGLIALTAYLFVGVCIPIWASRRLNKVGAAHREHFGALNGYFLDSVRGIREVLQYQCGALRQKELERRTQEMEETAWRMKQGGAFVACASNFAVLAFSLLTFFISALLYMQGQIAVSAVVITTITMMSSFGPVIALANLGAGLSQTIASGNRVLDVLSEMPVVQDVSNGIALQKQVVPQGAHLQNVDFSYDEQMILEQCTIEIKQGEITGITGKSGCGKSTVLKLLMRFWNAQSGTITFGGKEIKRINTSCLRELQSFVTQDTYLFHDSIASNLKIAKPSATQEQMIIACKKASIHDFIESLPQGYDTPVGELGGTLSGGERQRIGIARAFLHDAPLMLLDEPTSNLDSLNEAIILRALDCDKNHTIVLVSHRASTMAIAQKVYHFDTNRNS